MEQPLIVSILRERDARNALKRSDCEVQFVPSRSRLLKAELPRPPRLFVIQAPASEVEETRDLLVALRGERPLTDVLLWMPHASGTVVRTLFHAGAKDIVVSRSVAKLLECIHDTLQQQQILPRINDLSRQRSRGSRFESMLSRNEAMWDLFDLCTRIAPANATVLIVGETGTGKELLARAVHRRSGRQGRFVAANCASIPPELVSSELFGHEKGAFTGADRAKKGLVRHADQGTLFLDEIGDMPLESQQNLLRMVQEKQIRPVGGLGEIQVDVRVVAATNTPLDQAVRAGTFREDLFYRLDVIRMNVPPLRDRPEDIMFLFGYFTKRLAKHYGLNPPTFSDSFLDELLKYDWPGNVRQLENFCERLVLARPQRALAARDFAQLRGASLAESARSVEPVSRGNLSAPLDTSRTLADYLTPIVEQLEREYLQALLASNGGRVAQSAQQAGISRRTLLRKMKYFGLQKQAFKS